MRNHLRLLASALCALGFGACATAPLTLNDNLIVPGERVGDVEIGMSLSQLLALKGTPQRTVPIVGTAATTYAFDGLTVAAHDTVYWIIATDERFKTAGGVAPGVEQIVARAAFETPRCAISQGDTTVYDYGTFYFNVANTTGKVTEIGVLANEQSCDR